MLEQSDSTKLFRIRWILASGVLFLSIIIFTFLSQDNLELLASSNISSKITGIFLITLLDIDPDNRDIRMMLVQHHSKLGNWNDAYNALIPLLYKDKDLQTRFMMIEILKNELYLVNHDVTKYISIKSKLIYTLNDVLKYTNNLSNDQLIYFADLYKQLSRPDIASIIYEFLSKKDINLASHWLNLAAEAQLAYSQPLKSAFLYHSAFLNTSRDTKISNYYSHKAIESFIYANKLSTALTYLQIYVNYFPDDIELLIKGRDISLALENHTYALKYGNLLLSLEPDNEVFLANQRDLGLSTGNYDIALSMSKRLISKYSCNTKYLQKHAQIAEWSQEYDIALSQWRTIAFDYNDHEALSHVIRLSKDIFDYSSLIDALKFKSLSKRLTDNEINDIVYAYTKINNLHSALTFLSRYINSYNTHIYALKSLAYLYENNNDFDNAFDTWVIINKYSNNQFDSVFKLLILANKHSHKQQAFDIALNYIDIKTIDNKIILSLLGDITWDLNMHVLSEIVYSKLWSIDKTNTLSSERLINIYKNNNDHSKAVDIAIKTFNNGERPRFLLIAIDILISTSDWSQANALLKTINNKNKLKDYELFWLQNALVAIHYQEYIKAEKYYNKALDINPNSDKAEIGLLWLYVETDNSERLTEYFSNASNKYAYYVPEYWHVYALALAKLGWTDQAEYWYQLIINNNNHNIDTLKSFSETLAYAGKKNIAARLNKYIFSSQRNKLHQSMTNIDFLQ